MCDEDDVVSTIVGSVFGGLILGVILTVLVVFIYQNIRNGKLETVEIEYPKADIFNNTSSEAEIKAIQKSSVRTLHWTNEKRVIESAFAPSDEFPMKRNDQEAKEGPNAKNDINDDVYNHLNEKEEGPDNENYDHAFGYLNQAMEESDYSNLNTERRKESGVTSSEDNDYDLQEQ